MARLTQLEIDTIRHDLSCLKEDDWDECWGGCDPDDENYDAWSMETWDKFDALKLEFVYPQDEDYTHGIIAESIAKGFTVGDLYDLLSDIEKEIYETA